MKNVLLIPIGAIILTAAPVSDSDRQQLLDHLNRTKMVFAEALRGLSPEQANFKPAPDRWSVLQLAEHLTLAEDFLLGRTLEGLKVGDGKPSAASDEAVLQGWGTRQNKVKAPPNLEPSGRWHTTAAVEKEFDVRRAKTIDFVQTTQEDLRGHLCCGGISVYQQLLGLSAHVLRHVDQMNEVKADPNYPKH
jgi:DinB superfamily